MSSMPEGNYEGVCKQVSHRHITHEAACRARLERDTLFFRGCHIGTTVTLVPPSHCPGSAIKWFMNKMGETIYIPPFITLYGYTMECQPLR